jgi:hypothetical protein
VRQQHLEGNSRSTGIVSSELRQDFYQLLFQVKLALIVKPHADRGGDDYLRQRSQIVDRVGFDAP